MLHKGIELKYNHSEVVNFLYLMKESNHEQIEVKINVEHWISY